MSFKRVMIHVIIKQKQIFVVKKQQIILIKNEG